MSVMTLALNISAWNPTPREDNKKQKKVAVSSVDSSTSVDLEEGKFESDSDMVTIYEHKVSDDSWMCYDSRMASK